MQHAGSLVSAEDSALGRRLVRYVDGGIFGELDFFLRHPRSFSAVASTPDTCVQVLTRDALQSMQSQAPQLAAALEHALLKYLSFQVRYTRYTRYTCPRPAPDPIYASTALSRLSSHRSTPSLASPTASSTRTLRTSEIGMRKERGVGSARAYSLHDTDTDGLD